MSRYVYRCSRCRTRNTFTRPLSGYVRHRKCRDCGHARFYVDRERMTRVPCRCEGAYHWGPHRKGSRHCIHNPLVDVHRARRQGLDEIDILLAGLGGQVYQPGATCPF